jgi:hypothetical protein
MFVERLLMTYQRLEVDGMLDCFQVGLQDRVFDVDTVRDDLRLVHNHRGDLVIWWSGERRWRTERSEGVLTAWASACYG